jgi:lysophospholipase L1-like esterase
LKKITAVGVCTVAFSIGLLIGTSSMIPTAQIMRWWNETSGKHDGQHVNKTAVALGQADRFYTAPADIVMVGDSITHLGRWDEMFPGRNVINRGISADTVGGLLTRIEVIRASRAKRTFLMIGINDITAGNDSARTAAIYEQIVVALKPDTEMFIQTTVPCAALRCDRWTLANVVALNLKLKKIAQRQGVGLIDLAHALAPEGTLPEALSADGVHLTAQGYRRWRDVLSPYVLAPFKKERAKAP